MDINSPVTAIKGVGAKTAESFEKLNIHTVGDLVLRFPRDYIRYPFPEDLDESFRPQPDGTYAIRARVMKAPVVRNARRMAVTILNIGAPGYMMQLVWYRMPYLKNTLVSGKHFVFYGKVTVKNGHFIMEQPAVYEEEAYAEIAETLQPVYSLTAGVSNKLISRTVMKALDSDLLLQDYIPLDIRDENSLCEYNYALKQIHFPDSMDDLIRARKRLVFDEFFLFILGIQFQREKKMRDPNLFHFEHEEMIGDLMKKLPYRLTGAQKKALDEVVADMKGPFAMQRLIQGDVGSGKTIIAFLLMAWVSANGRQSAIMAPTEVLARQHFETFRKNCEMFGLKIPVVLLTGSMTAKQKRNAYERLKLYPNAMIIGTHALIQDRTEFNNLALVITDEQHRFGVKQRETFSGKGDLPHILVMSATPIPRTLAIIIYGDMDISVIDEVPAKRLPIRNCVVGTSYRPKAYEFIKKEVESGHQAYVICPFVEASEEMEGENVTDYASVLREQLPEEIKLGVLHGKMKGAKKDEIMEAFAANEIQVLISTTVVEVGVNVPNATVMMIENADRFGLAQLHQLRGRVGRGDAQSYCIMVNTSNTESAKKRLEILNKSNDGFFIASEDLKLRGPGDFFGIRQSGDLAFQLGDIYQDAAVLQAASEAVKEILEEDPELTHPGHENLERRITIFMEEQVQRMSL